MREASPGLLLIKLITLPKRLTGAGGGGSIGAGGNFWPLSDMSGTVELSVKIEAF